MSGSNRNQNSTPDAAQRRRDQQRGDEEETIYALLLLRGGFGEFGLWGNVPGNAPGTLPLQWQQNWQSFPGARPVSFGLVAGSSHQTTTATTAPTANATNAYNPASIPAESTSATTSHGRPVVPTARLDTLATVAASRERLPLAEDANRPLSDRTNGATSAVPSDAEIDRARSMATSPEELPPSPELPRRSQAPSTEVRN